VVAYVLATFSCEAVILELHASPYLATVALDHCSTMPRRAILLALTRRLVVG
jgi:hypothetical protein